MDTDPEVQRRTDATLRWGLLQLVMDRPRPAEAWHDVARGRSHPWRVLLRRLVEAAQVGVSRARADGFLEAFREVLDLVWSAAARPFLRLLKPAPAVRQLPRRRA